MAQTQHDLCFEEVAAIVLLWLAENNATFPRSYQTFRQEAQHLVTPEIQGRVSHLPLRTILGEYVVLKESHRRRNEFLRSDGTGHLVADTLNGVYMLLRDYEEQKSCFFQGKTVTPMHRSHPLPSSSLPPSTSPAPVPIPTTAPATAPPSSSFFESPSHAPPVSHATTAVRSSPSKRKASQPRKRTVDEMSQEELPPVVDNLLRNQELQEKLAWRICDTISSHPPAPDNVSGEAPLDLDTIAEELFQSLSNDAFLAPLVRGASDPLPPTSAPIAQPPTTSAAPDTDTVDVDAFLDRLHYA